MEGFETISFGNAGLTVSITRNGTTFNKNIVDKLGRPNNVVVMINRANKQFAIRAATAKDSISVPFCAGERPGPSVRWNSKEFLKILCDLAGWDLKKTSYHINGNFISSEKAIVFDLNEAQSN